MANITRCKDAAMAICERGPPRRNARLMYWKHTRESPSGGRRCVRSPAPASGAPPQTSQPRGRAHRAPNRVSWDKTT
jgi:hypothetical protein